MTSPSTSSATAWPSSRRAGASWALLSPPSWKSSAATQETAAHEEDGRVCAFALALAEAVPAAVASDLLMEPGEVGVPVGGVLGLDRGGGAATGREGRGVGGGGPPPAGCGRVVAQLELVADRLDPEEAAGHGEQRPLDGVGPAQAVAGERPVKLPIAQPAHAPEGHDRERMPGQPPGRDEEPPPGSRPEPFHQRPQGSTAVTATTANSRVRYAID